MLGSRDTSVKNPIVGSWFRIERGPVATPPKYEYDETGVVFEGQSFSVFQPSAACSLTIA